MMRDPEDVLKYLNEIEAAAEDILTDKEQIVNLDRRRNEMRKAQRMLFNDSKNQVPEKKLWLCMGNLFLKMKTTTVKDILDKDQKTLDTEINGLRNGLQSKVAMLRDLEGKPELRGFALQPLSHQEVAAIGSILR